jgi:hypothetical protein
MGRGDPRVERGDRAKAPEANPGGGGEDLGIGVGQDRREDRLAEAHAAERLSGVAEEGGG